MTWRTWLVTTLIGRRGLDTVWLQGFMAGLRQRDVASRGAIYTSGFIEGRASVRDVPLDAPLPDDEEEDPPCRH
jgi:hypothetical protein